jgi:hypothetical protein
MLNPLNVIKTMKEILKFITSLAIIVIAVVAVIWATGSTVLPNNDKFSSEDSVHVAEIVKSMQEPTSWSSYAELDEYLKKEADNYYNDSVVATLPCDVLENVVNVLIKKNPNKKFTKRDIANEYWKNKSVYDNLPKKDELSNSKPIRDSISSEFKDTVINGVPVKILLETHFN